ncbi:hypothetical protein, partial [Micromonospora sp. 4G55]|uniref:hypothetical protein n=1 Tax=Micromonospora sp. 4G55 TaxID=2806102 RepID=UPI001EE3AB94
PGPNPATSRRVGTSLRESQFELRLVLVRFPSYDRAEILRRLTAYEAGRLTPPGPIDRSSMTPTHLA